MRDSIEDRFVVYESLEAAKADWVRLAERAGNVFLTWEWASVWWSHFGAGTLRLVAVAGPDGEVRAILPLYATAGRVRALRLLGHGHAIELGLVCAPDDAPAAVSELTRYLRLSDRDWDLFLAHDVPPPWSEQLGGRTIGRTPNPVVELSADSWDAYLGSRSRSFRDDLRKSMRRLEREHEVRYRLTEAPEQLGPDLDALFALHRQRWGDEATVHFAGAEAFHRDFAARALERGWLRHAVLELDGRVVAANLGFRFGAVAWTYNAGRDPNVRGGGFLLTAYDIERSIEEGIREYRLGRGATTYKDRFATSSVDHATIGVPRGLVGRASLTARQYAGVLPPRARAWLEHRAA